MVELRTERTQQERQPGWKYPWSSTWLKDKRQKQVLGWVCF